MLRVLPTRFTSALPELRRLLLDLGLVPAEEGQGWAVLDSRSGRVRLRTAERGSERDGTVVFGVEIRNPAEFARRTADDGGSAALVESPAGARVLVTGQDGFSFYAEPTGHTGQYVDADPDLAVRLEWRTPDPGGAAATLAAIGARRRADTLGPEGSREFTAKNGGVLAAVPAPTASAALAFEYAGPLGELEARLALAGWTVEHDGADHGRADHGGAGDAVREAAEAPGRADGVVRVTVPLPDGSDVTVLVSKGHAPASMR